MAPWLSPALPCRSLLSLARCRLSSGQAVTLRPQDVPKLPRSVPKTLPLGPPALIQDGRPRLTPPGVPAMIKDGHNPSNLPRAVDPRELLALIQDGRRDSRIGWCARAAMLSEAGAAAASRHARRAAGCPEEGAGRLLTTWRPLAPPREEEAEGEEAAGGGRSLIHREPGLLPSPPPSPSSPLPSGRPRPLPGTMSFFRRKGRGAAGGRPGAEGRPPPSSPARLLGPGPAPPGTASGPREEARPLRSELPANDGQSRHLPAPAAGPFSSLRGRGRGRGGGRGCAGTAAAGPGAVGCGLPARRGCGGDPRQPRPSRGGSGSGSGCGGFRPSSARGERGLAALERGTPAVRGTGVKGLAPPAIFQPLHLFTELFFFSQCIGFVNI